MGWGRQDDGYYDHPKVLALTLEAIGLEWLAISYANRHHTDGVMSLETARYLARGDRTDLFAQLVQSRRWCEQKSPGSEVVTGYVVHDFLDYNESAKEWERKKKQAVKRMRRLRSGSRDVRENFAGGSRNVPGRAGKGSKRWRTVPEGELLTEARRTYAKDAGLANGEVETEWAKYVDHEFFRPKQNVDKTWRNWCREAVERERPRGAARAPVRVLPNFTGAGIVK